SVFRIRIRVNRKFNGMSTNPHRLETLSAVDDAATFFVSSKPHWRASNGNGTISGKQTDFQESACCANERSVYVAARLPDFCCTFAKKPKVAIVCKYRKKIVRIAFRCKLRERINARRTNVRDKKLAG